MHRILGRVLAAILAVTGLIIGASATGASALPAPAAGEANTANIARPAITLGNGTVVTIRNAYSNKCLDDYGFSTADGNAIVQHTCNGYQNQKWIAVAVPNTNSEVFYFQNEYSGLYLDDYAFSRNDGNIIRQYHFDGYDNQKWHVAGGFVQNIYSGLFLDDYAFSVDNDTPVRQYHYTGTLNQVWLFN